MSSVEVLVVEPETNIAQPLIDSLAGFLKAAGGDFRLTLASGVDEVIEAIEAGRCDIFVTDLSLGSKTGTPLGLVAIDDLKAAHPLTFCIGVSGGDASVVDAEARQHGMDLFLPKAYLFSGDFNSRPDYLARFRERYRRLPFLSLTISGDVVPKPSDTPPPTKAEIRGLLRTLMGSNWPPDFAVAPSRIALTPLTGGRSASVVFRAEPVATQTDLQLIPFVLKISGLDDFKEEVRRFEKYVKWTLPYVSRAEILGTAAGARWGAIGYTFAHGGLGPFDTLTKRVSAADVTAVSEGLEHLFTEGRRFWTPIAAPPAYASVRQRYFERYFAGDQERFNVTINSFALWLEHNGGRRSNHEITIFGRKFPRVDRVLTQGNPGQFVGSLAHGDLNTNNVIVSEDNKVCLIDFRDSCIGHLFEDFVTLEVCLRLYWPDWDTGPGASDGEEPETLFRFEADLDAGRLPSDIAQLIAKVRSSAKEMAAEYWNERAYIFGVCYYALRLMRLGDLKAAPARRLLICMLHNIEKIN